MTTRRMAMALVLAALAATSGCLGVITGEEPLSFEADPTSTDEAVAADAGYESAGTQAQVVNQSVTVAGQTREVKATTYVTKYRKSLSIPAVGEANLGTFAVVSTPAAEVAGRELNPIADYDNDDLVRMLSGGYSGVDGSNPVESRRVTALGTEMDVSKYAGQATFGGQSVDVYIHVGKVRHGDDYVVALAVYPQQFSEGENVYEMIRALVHPVPA